MGFPSSKDAMTGRARRATAVCVLFLVLTLVAARSPRGDDVAAQGRPRSATSPGPSTPWEPTGA